MVVEALQCGRAVVASDVGGVSELVGSDCGVLVPPNNPPRLAEAIAEALHRPWDEVAIALRSSRTWKNVAAETYEICQTVMAGRNGRRIPAAIRSGAA